jgi:F-box interacting protein
MEVVGACNGVLCLCDDARPGGAITLLNPATADILALPPIPCAGVFRRHNTRRPGRSWHQAYSFGYHHATGQYKVVHVPCFFKTKETLHVFTLGEASWREVPVPDARCRLDAGLVSVSGATYWVTEGSKEKIMAFDHRSEQVRSTKPLPMSARRPICQLTQVHRRLSAATSDQIHGRGSIEVIFKCSTSHIAFISKSSNLVQLNWHTFHTGRIHPLSTSWFILQFFKPCNKFFEFLKLRNHWNSIRS